MAGRLDTRVVIVPKVDTNTLGSVATTFPTSGARGTRWAERRGLSGTEQFANPQLDANVDHRFTFRSDTVTRTIRPSDRLLVGSSSDGMWYDISSAVDPNLRGRKSEVVVFATQRHV